MAIKPPEGSEHGGAAGRRFASVAEWRGPPGCPFGRAVVARAAGNHLCACSVGQAHGEIPDVIAATSTLVRHVASECIHRRRSLKNVPRSLADNSGCIVASDS